MSTLRDLRLAIAERIDAAFSGLDVPPSEYCDVNDIAVYEDLPRAIFSWGLKPDYPRVVDIDTTKDYDQKTATLQEMIPHTMGLKIMVVSPELDEAQNLAQDVLEEFGRAPCIEGMCFYYEGTDSAAGAFSKGLFAYTLSYSGWLWLPGHAVTTPLVEQVDLQIGSTESSQTLQDQNPPPQENQPPTGTIDDVVVKEILWDLLTS